MRGRKAKPTALRLVTSKPDRRRDRPNEPKPRRVIPSPPEHLSDRAKIAWGSLSTRMDRLGILTELDVLALERLCENYAEILELQQDIRDGGRNQKVTTKSGDAMERARPVVAQFSDAERRFRGLMCDFGLTPSSRTRVATDGHGNERTDPAEAYFG